MHAHSKTVFEMLDEDSSGTISVDEFERLGFLLNLDNRDIRLIFQDFDISGDDALDYAEFRMFTLACINNQKSLKKNRLKLLLQRRLKFLAQQREPLVKYINKTISQCVPWVFWFHSPAERHLPLVFDKGSSSSTLVSVICWSTIRTWPLPMSHCRCIWIFLVSNNPTSVLLPQLRWAPTPYFWNLPMLIESGLRKYWNQPWTLRAPLVNQQDPPPLPEVIFLRRNDFWTHRLFTVTSVVCRGAWQASLRCTWLGGFRTTRLHWSLFFCRCLQCLGWFHRWLNFPNFLLQVPLDQFTNFRHLRRRFMF